MHPETINNIGKKYTYNIHNDLTSINPTMSDTVYCKTMTFKTAHSSYVHSCFTASINTQYLKSLKICIAIICSRKSLMVIPVSTSVTTFVVAIEMHVPCFAAILRTLLYLSISNSVGCVTLDFLNCI